MRVKRLRWKENKIIKEYYLANCLEVDRLSEDEIEEAEIGLRLRIRKLLDWEIERPTEALTLVPDPLKSGKP